MKPVIIKAVEDLKHEEIIEELPAVFTNVNILFIIAILFCIGIFLLILKLIISIYLCIKDKNKLKRFNKIK